jgi:adenylate kinase
MQPQIIILLGRSGSGKGTQAKLLIKEFGFSYWGTGDLLRKKIAQGDDLGRELKKFMDRGDLVPTEVVFKIWSEKIREMKGDIEKKGLVIDGSPRMLEEAKMMDGLFEEFGWENIKVILIDISEQEAFDRLTKRRICKECGRLIPWVGDFRGMKVCDKCGGELITRDDDKPEAIRARLDFYNKDVQPAVDYYQEKGILIKIDGDKSIEDVYKNIKKAIQ